MPSYLNHALFSAQAGSSAASASGAAAGAAGSNGNPSQLFSIIAGTRWDAFAVGFHQSVGVLTGFTILCLARSPAGAGKPPPLPPFSAAVDAAVAADASLLHLRGLRDGFLGVFVSLFYKYRLFWSESGDVPLVSELALSHGRHMFSPRCVHQCFGCRMYPPFSSIPNRSASPLCSPSCGPVHSKRWWPSGRRCRW